MAELTKQVFADVEASKYQVDGSIKLYHTTSVCTGGGKGINMYLLFMGRKYLKVKIFGLCPTINKFYF